MDEAVEKIEFTPEELVEAYKRTGIVPIFESWGERRDIDGENDKLCACAVTAVLADKFGLDKVDELLEGIDLHGTVVPAKMLGWTKDETEWFIQGYDDGEIPEWRRRTYTKEKLEWYDFGAECSSAVIEAFGMKIKSGNEDEEEI